MEIEPCLHGGKRPPFGTSAGPDGAEAWMVALAACSINFVMAGLGRMSGILYVAMIDIFHTDRRQASLPFTVRSSMRNLLGPLVGILGQKYGVRPVIIVGGIIGTLSSAACFYINDIGWITVVWGGINGIGTALTTTLPQVVIGQHFKKYRATASGIAFSGGCVGSFMFPALIEHLLYTYDLGGTFLLISSFIMHVIPAALILKTPSWSNRKKTIIKKASEDEFEKQRTTVPRTLMQEGKGDGTGFTDDNLPQVESNGIESSSPLLCGKGTASERQRMFRCDVDSDLLWKNKHLLIKLLTDNSTLSYEKSRATLNGIYHSDDLVMKDIELLLRQSGNHSSNGNLCSQADTSCITPPVFLENERKSPESEDVHFSNGRLKCETLNGEVDTISIDYLAYYVEKLFQRDRNDILREFKDLEEQKTAEKILLELEKLQDSLSSKWRDALDVESNKSSKRSNTFNAHIRTALRLYLKPMFLLICFCRAVHFMTFVPAVTTVVDFAMDRGLQPEDGKYTIGALSLGDLMGRLCFGWITDYGYVTLPRYMMFVMVLQGCATAALPVMHSRHTLMPALSVFGLLMGSSFVRHPVLIARYFTEHEQSIAMGCIDFFSGLIGFILPAFIGYFRDVVGSYDGMYYICGCISSFVGFCWYFEPFLLKYTPDCDEEETLQTSNV